MVRRVLKVYKKNARVPAVKTRSINTSSKLIVREEVPVPPPESFYIGSSSPDGGSKIRRIIGSDTLIQIPHVQKSVAVQ